MEERDKLLYDMAFLEGQRVARCLCDVCPARTDVCQPVLIAGRDVLYRPGIEN